MATSRPSSSAPTTGTWTTPSWRAPAPNRCSSTCSTTIAPTSSCIRNGRRSCATTSRRRSSSGARTTSSSHPRVAMPIFSFSRRQRSIGWIRATSLSRTRSAKSKARCARSTRTTWRNSLTARLARVLTCAALTPRYGAARILDTSIAEAGHYRPETPRRSEGQDRRRQLGAPDGGGARSQRIEYRREYKERPRPRSYEREPVPRRCLLICLATIQDPSASSRVTCLFPTSPHERIVRERKRHSPRLLAFAASQPIGEFSPGHATPRTGTDPSPHRRSRHARAAAIRFTPGFACDVCPLRVKGGLASEFLRALVGARSSPNSGHEINSLVRWRSVLSALALLLAAKGTSVILVLNQYKCIGCSPRKRSDTRTMAIGSDDDSLDSVHDRCSCISV